MHLFASDRDRLATVLAAAMRTSAPVSAESAWPAWEGTRSGGALPTAAGRSAKMCSTVCRGSPASLWSSSYMTVLRVRLAYKACASFAHTFTLRCHIHCHGLIACKSHKHQAAEYISANGEITASNFAQAHMRREFLMAMPQEIS